MKLYYQMENKLKELLNKMKSTNDEISKRINSGECSEYEHSAKVHIYNNNIGWIKEIEKLLNK